MTLGNGMPAILNLASLIVEGLVAGRPPPSIWAIMENCYASIAILNVFLILGVGPTMKTTWWFHTPSFARKNKLLGERKYPENWWYIIVEQTVCCSLLRQSTQPRKGGGKARIQRTVKHQLLIEDFWIPHCIVVCCRACCYGHWSSLSKCMHAFLWKALRHRNSLLSAQTSNHWINWKSTPHSSHDSFQNSRPPSVPLVELSLLL